MMGKMSIPPGPGKRGKSIPPSLIIFSPYGGFNHRSNTNSIRTPTRSPNTPDGSFSKTGTLLLRRVWRIGLSRG